MKYCQPEIPKNITQKTHEIVLALFRGEISYFFVHIPIFSSLYLPMVCANSHKLPVMQFWLPPQGFLLEKLSEIKLQAGLHQLVRRACSFSSNITILFSTLLSPTAKFFPSYQLDSPSPTAIQTFGNSCLSPDVLVSRPLCLSFLSWLVFCILGLWGRWQFLHAFPSPITCTALQNLKWDSCTSQQLIQSLPYVLFCL